MTFIMILMKFEKWFSVDVVGDDVDKCLLVCSRCCYVIYFDDDVVLYNWIILLRGVEFLLVFNDEDDVDDDDVHCSYW